MPKTMYLRLHLSRDVRGMSFVMNQQEMIHVTIIQVGIKTTKL